MSNEIPVIYHNASNYYYHFIIKELPNEFEGQLECLMENTKTFQTFSIPIEVKEIKKIDKDGNESVVTISFERKFIDIARFMATSLSNLVHNLIEGIHKIKCKNFHCFLEMKVKVSKKIQWNLNVHLAIKLFKQNW